MKRRSVLGLGAALGITAAVSGCRGPLSATTSATTGATTNPGTTPVGTAAPTDAGHQAHRAIADKPGALRGSDLLIASSGPLSTSLLQRVRTTPGVEDICVTGLAVASVSGRSLTIAAVDPEEFRRFTPYATAESEAIWRRVAQGQLLLDPSLGKKVQQPAGYLTLGNSGAGRLSGTRPAQLPVGAVGPLPPRIQVVLDQRWAPDAGITPGSAVIVSTGATDPTEVVPRLKALLPREATMQVLALEFDIDAPQTAVLTGQSLASAVGSFSYTPLPDGSVIPAASWVKSFIRTQPVPIIGSVTGNKALFAPLIAALEEITSLGLAPKIIPSQYGGCYVPRYIAHDPALGLSLHSWGIAVDLNVPENERGTRGNMDPGIVNTFEKWGFTWGGTWHYTDPMHFEMNRIVEPS